MSFLKLFTERASAYKNDEMLIGLGFLPLTKKISELLGGGKYQEAFHLTSLEYLPNLKKIKGDKSISTFTRGLGSVVNGVNVKPDVCVKLEGNVVLFANKDIFTHVDRSGLRWINLRTIQNNDKKYKFILEATAVKITKYANDKFNLEIPENHINAGIIDPYWNKLKAKEKKEVKDFYIKNFEQLLQNKIYLDIIKEFIESEDKTKYKHNEVVMNRFKILGVYSIEAGKFQFDHSMAQYQIEKLGFKYLGHIPKEDFGKVSVETY